MSVLADLAEKEFEQLHFFRTSVLPRAASGRDLTREEVGRMFRWADLCDATLARLPEAAAAAASPGAPSPSSSSKALVVALLNNLSAPRAAMEEAARARARSLGYPDVDLAVAADQRRVLRRLLLDLDRLGRGNEEEPGSR